MLPEIFENDDYSSCVQNNNLYCTLRAKLSTFRNDTLKEYVKNLTQDVNLFDRSILRRSICVPKLQESYESYVRTESEIIINERIKHFEITANVEYINCTDGNIPTTLYDYIILSIVLIYATFVIFSTYYEISHRNQKEKNGFQKLISEFSIFYNWKKKTNISKNEDFEKLSSMQGLRFFTMALIIPLHSNAAYAFVHVANPTDFEFLMSQPGIPYFNIMNMHLVLNFFLLSSWLLTIHVSEIVKTYGEFSLRHIGIIVLNRYFRLIVAAGFVMAFFSTSWAVKIFSGPLNFDVVQSTQDMCRKHFLYDLLFLQNYLNSLDTCNPVSWYIAADFQLYILNIIVLYIWFRFKFNTKRFLTTVLVCSIAVYGYILYLHNSNGIYLLHLRNAILAATKPAVNNIMIITYMSAYSIFPASLIGTIFGVLYLQYKNKIIKSTPLLSTLWALCFIGLPHLVFVLDSLELQRIPAAIVGSISKPLYCLGIAIGIFGMSHNLGGPIKKYFEHKYVVILGNFTYCPYICQWLFMLGRHRISPPFVAIPSMLIDASILLIKACIFGVTISLTVEEPGLSTQKKILPQIKKYEVLTEKKK